MKKLLSLLIVTVIFLSTAPGALAAEDLQEKMDYIASLGIMVGYEDGSLRPDNLITRAEFTAVAVRLAGQTDSAGAWMYDGRFSDVSQDFWGAGHIGLALNMGIINGYTDGTFLPGNNVTYNEAVKMIVCLLGYGFRAEALGGYPSGYMSVASQLRLLDFAYQAPDLPMNRGDVARLVYNALDVELMLLESVGPSGSYVIGKGGTVLETFFHAQTGNGIVTATELDSLHGNRVLKGYVEIDDKAYKTDFDCAGFLGERVEYIVTDNDGEERVVYLRPDSSVSSVTVSAEELIDIEGIFTSTGQLRYLPENQNVKKLSFTAAVNVIYNNKLLSYENAGSVDFAADPDIYECMDTDFDGVYDLLKLKAYEDHYVRRIYAGEGTQTVVTDNSKTIVYDPEDEDLFFTIIHNGEIVPFTEIKEGDVISVAKSLDSQAYEMIISRETIESTVSARTQSDTNVTLTIDDHEYRVSDSLVAKQKVPALGDSGTFYLTFGGEVAYFEGTDTADGIYGFLTDVVNGGGLAQDCKIKILETNNTFSVYPLAQKVRLSSGGVESTKTAGEIVGLFDKPATWDDMRQAYTQIIRYKLNADGAVSYIATAKESPDAYSFSVAAPNRKRFYSNSLFDQKWKVTSDTVVFYIPSTKEGEDYTRYRAGTASSYFTSGNTYQVILYDADENGELGAVFYSLTGQLREQTFSIDLATSQVMTIDKITYRNDENGETHCTVSGIVNNNYTSIYVSEEFLASSANRDMLKHGNVIQFVTNSSQVRAAHYEGQAEEIMKAILLCDFSTTPMRKQWNRTGIEQNSPKLTTVYGIVESIDNTKITVSVPDAPEGTTEVYIEESQSVIKMNDKTADMGTFYDIQPGREIFVRMRYDKIRDVVIYTE